jgi:hypothetical protein
VNRRRFLIAGTGAAAAAIAAPYLPLVVGAHFEAFVADKLGLEEALATALLERMRERLGDGDYDRHAAAFAVALRDPYAALVPGGARSKAVETFVGELLREPPDRLAYLTGSPPAAACAGLRRDA